jgi:hypothetical protein
MLFNLPDEIDVSVDNINISGSKFDYYNPLLLNARILEKVKFYNKATRQIVDEFSCFCLTSKSLHGLFDQILNTSIYYPSEFCIDYKTVTATRIAKGKQFCDIVTQISHPRSPPNGTFMVPMPMSMMRWSDRTMNSSHQGPSVMFGPSLRISSSNSNPGLPPVAEMLLTMMSMMGDSNDDDDMPPLINPNQNQGPDSDGQSF